MGLGARGLTMAVMNQTSTPEHRAAPLWALGLISGTSMDGIDAALIQTDGRMVNALGPSLTLPYPDDLRARLGAVLGRADRDAPDIRALDLAVTDVQAAAAERLIRVAGIDPAEIALIGFHGQTIFHDARAGVTVQLGDGPRMAARLGRPVVWDFRAADVAAGGQGAPFAPAYHAALAARAGAAPVAFLNLGGVGNVTYVGGEGDLIAFDTGPANALIDDWVAAHGAGAADLGGAIAATGRVDAVALAALMDHPFFAAPPPKSLDRNAFSPAPVRGLSLADGAATLSAFTAVSVAACVPLLPARPGRWIVCGGGRHNVTLMAMLADRLAAPVEPVERLGVDGDAVEAQAFGYLAVRSRRGLALSFPGTTGVPSPCLGGRLAEPV